MYARVLKASQAKTLKETVAPDTDVVHQSQVSVLTILYSNLSVGAETAALVSPWYEERYNSHLFVSQISSAGSEPAHDKDSETDNSEVGRVHYLHCSPILVVLAIVSDFPRSLTMLSPHFFLQKLEDGSSDLSDNDFLESPGIKNSEVRNAGVMGKIRALKKKRQVAPGEFCQE